MSAPYKSVFVPIDDQDVFDASLDVVLHHFGMNFSEFVRQIVMHGQTLEKQELSQFMSREARKADDYKYIVLAVKVQK